MRKATKMTIHRLPITKARVNLGQVARRVMANGEYFILEKDGIPVMGIMGPDELEDYLELRDPKIQKIIARGHKDYLAGRTRPADELQVELDAVAAKKLRRGNKRKKA